MDLKNKIKKSLDEKYRESTVERIQSGIKNIFVNVFQTETFDKKLLYKFRIIKKYLETKEVASRKTLVANILSILKSEKSNKRIIERYERYFKKIVLDYEDESKYKEKTQKEKDNFVEWSYIEDLKNKYKGYVEKLKYPYSFKDMILFEKYLILELYTGIPPLRGEDYFNTKLEYDKENNYINLKTRILYLKKYKTSDKYGKRRIKIPLHINKLLKKWFYIQKGYNKNLYNYWLLPKISSELKENINSKGFSKMMSEIFKPKKISSVLLRKMYISKELSDPDITPFERKRIAKIMGHSLEMQEFIYSKYRK